jgi:hypothetical protein
VSTISAIVAGLSVSSVILAHMALTETLALFLGAAAFYHLARWTRRNPAEADARRSWLWAILLLSLGAVTRPSSWPFAVAGILWGVFFARPAGIGARRRAGLSLLAGVPLIAQATLLAATCGTFAVSNIDVITLDRYFLSRHQQVVEGGRRPVAAVRDERDADPDGWLAVTSPDLLPAYRRRVSGEMRAALLKSPWIAVDAWGINSTQRDGLTGSTRVAVIGPPGSPGVVWSFVYNTLLNAVGFAGCLWVFLRRRRDWFAVVLALWWVWHAALTGLTFFTGDRIALPLHAPALILFALMATLPSTPPSPTDSGDRHRERKSPSPPAPPIPPAA